MPRVPHCTVLYCTVLYCTVLYRVPYSASKFAIRGTMEALYVELRQNHPGNQLHLMLVSPFIVETGAGHRTRHRELSTNLLLVECAY